MSSSDYPSTRCAACKYLRRRCAEDCVLAPHFPADRADRFACVHKIFGAGNVTRMLQQLPEHQRAEAAESMAYEAQLRMQNPVHGSVGIIHNIYQQIQSCERQLAWTRAQITMLAAAQAQQPPNYQLHQRGNDQEQEEHHLMHPNLHQDSGDHVPSREEQIDRPFLDLSSQIPDS